MENFYPSISSNLFKNQLNLQDSSSTFLMMIFQSLCWPEKSFFLKVQRSGLKKSGNEDFEVPIGCFNGAEIRELVGIYRQSKLTNIINKEKVGLYREDGLGTFKNISRPQIKGKKKAIVKMFKK